MSIKNQKIIDEFTKLINQIKIQIDNAPKTSDYIANNFRLKQISTALQIIKDYKKEIKSGSDLKDIKGIGKGTVRRIDEILKTGILSEIKISLTERKLSEAIEKLQQVHGIGHKTAFDLITKHNIYSVNELKKAHENNLIELNDQILTGLKYHGIYKQNIPRNEITQIKKYLEDRAKTIDKNLQITICGSYRRGKETSNDIDVLVSHPGIKTKFQLGSKDNYLLKLVKLLKTNNFLLDDLTDKNFEIKYMGYCKFKKNPVRRIDIRYIPYESYYTALLYFTGSGSFNKKMRRLAEQLGYLLNEYGLYKLSDNKEKKKRLKINSEKDVFDVLGMDYLEPKERE